MRRRKLPVYQYKLRLRVPIEPSPPARNLPHIRCHEGQFHLFRNRYKSQYVGPRLYAACISGVTISEVQQRLAKVYNRGSFGFYGSERNANAR